MKLKNLTRRARAYIESPWQKLNAYLQNERTREISQEESNETGIILFLFILVWVLALEFGRH